MAHLQRAVAHLWIAMAPRFATSAAAADAAAQSMAVKSAAAIKSAQAAAAAAAVTLPPWPMPEREYSKDTSPAPIACVGAAAAPAHKLAGTKCAAPVAAPADATLPPCAAAPAAAQRRTLWRRGGHAGCAFCDATRRVRHCGAADGGPRRRGTCDDTPSLTLCFASAAADTDNNCLNAQDALNRRQKFFVTSFRQGADMVCRFLRSDCHAAC